jgi:hypothetical protein
MRELEKTKIAELSEALLEQAKKFRLAPGNLSDVVFM